MKKSKFGGIMLFIFGLMLAALFTWICMDCANDVLSVFRTADTQVELEATITGADEYTEIDEGFERTYWVTTVSYTYQGESYSGVRYKSTYKEPQLGKIVSVAIDPQNPGELLPSDGEFTLSLLLSPVFLVGVTLCVFALTKILAEALQKKWEWINPDIAAYSLTGCKLVGESYFYYKNKGSWIFGVFSLVAAVACLIIAKKMEGNRAEEKEALPEI